MVITFEKKNTNKRKKTTTLLNTQTKVNASR